MNENSAFCIIFTTAIAVAGIGWFLTIIYDGRKK